MVGEPAGSDRILYFQYFLLVLGGILFPSCVFIKFFWFLILMLILNSVAIHFLVWWVLVLVCFPPAVKGPRGSTSPIRYKNPYPLLSPCSLTCIFDCRKKTYPLHRTPSLPPLATPFSPRVLLMHALSLVDNHSFPVFPSPAHNGSLPYRVHVMGLGGMIPDSRMTDK